MHSEYSINDGVGRLGGNIGNIITQAAKIGIPALALTDTGNMFGALKFYNACREAGIKPVIGCEAKIDGGAEDFYHLIFLCADNDGYVNLSGLITRAYAENGGKISPDWLNADATAALSPFPAPAAVLSVGNWHKADGNAHARSQTVGTKFPDSFYLEMWHGGREDDSHLCAATADLGRETGYRWWRRTRSVRRRRRLRHFGSASGYRLRLDA